MNEQLHAETCRRETFFGFDWQFALTDDLAFPPADAAWRSVQLPHDWSVEYPVDEAYDSCGSGGYARTGIGWYQKRFRVEKNADERVSLYFEGVYMNSDVWLNGVHLRRHVYGYTSFTVDLTDVLLKEENELLIRVDNSRQPNSRWYTGSGITRGVYLRVTQSLRVADWGMFVYTPVITDEMAEICVNLHILGVGAEGARVETAIFDPDGNQVALRQADIPMEADAVLSKALVALNPRLWDIDDPVLYSARCALYRGDILMDVAQTRFGIRQIAYTANEGFLLNGRKRILQGVCLHHDGGCVGAAVPPEIWKRRLQKFKAMGVNAVRCAHNPPDPALLDLTDELGFVVMDEAFDEWQSMKWKELGANTHDSKGYSEHFDECWREDMEAMVLRDRNHPSIVMWSIGNEVGEQTMENGHLIAQQLKDLCHTLDPTRLVTVACDQVKAEPSPATLEFLEELDIVGVNYVDRWRERTETFFDEEKLEHPDWLLLGTEDVSVSGRRGDYRLHTEESVWGPTPYYAKMLKAEKLWKYLRVHPYMIGSFMWTGIDHLGECFWPDKGASPGVLDTCGFPKDGYYFYQSVWRRDEPVLYLCPHLNLDIPEGTIYPVICYTNCFSVELFVGGKSYGVKAYEFPMQGMTQKWSHFDRPLAPVTTSDLHLSWDVPFTGEEIIAVGRDASGGEITRQTIRRAGKPVAMQLIADCEGLPADGRSVCQFEAALVDANGIVVPDDDRQIHVTVSGGILLGMDNGDPADHTLYQNPIRATYRGLLYGVLRAPRTPGTLTLTLQADRLPSVTRGFPVG